eukprot:6189316-Pleurochrysis_carterae.AAC.1
MSRATLAALAVFGSSICARGPIRAHGAASSAWREKDASRMARGLGRERRCQTLAELPATTRSSRSRRGLWIARALHLDDELEWGARPVESRVVPRAAQPPCRPQRSDRAVEDGVGRSGGRLGRASRGPRGRGRGQFLRLLSWRAHGCRGALVREASTTCALSSRVFARWLQCVGCLLLRSRLLELGARLPRERGWPLPIAAEVARLQQLVVRV